MLHELSEFIKLKNDNFRPEKIAVRNFTENILYKIMAARPYNLPTFNLKIDNKLQADSDPRILAIVLQCIIDNAVKYSIGAAEKPVVEIDAKISGGQLQIAVKDNGAGIDEDVKKNIFDMFYRGSSLSKGNGLGLYITRCMIDKLNGKILLESALNKGTSVTICIPVTVPESVFTPVKEKLKVPIKVSVLRPTL